MSKEKLNEKELEKTIGGFDDIDDLYYSTCGRGLTDCSSCASLNKWTWRGGGPYEGKPVWDCSDGITPYRIGHKDRPIKHRG